MGKGTQLSLQGLIPSPDDLLKLEPEEIGIAMLKVLASADPQAGTLIEGNFLRSASGGYMQSRRSDVRPILAEGWSWLLREGLIVSNPDSGDGWIMVSRRGKSLADTGNLNGYRQAHLLPRAALRAELLEAGVLGSFIRGDYDSAVLQAFRAVEINVRKAMGAGPEVVGTKLMRSAFDSDNGPLRSMDLPEAERDALSSLMAGAIGYFKNPHSHRLVGLDAAHEVVEMVLFANYLLRVVERAAKVKGLPE